MKAGSRTKDTSFPTLDSCTAPKFWPIDEFDRCYCHKPIQCPAAGDSRFPWTLEYVGDSTGQRIDPSAGAFLQLAEPKAKLLDATVTTKPGDPNTYFVCKRQVRQLLECPPGLDAVDLDWYVANSGSDPSFEFVPPQRGPNRAVCIKRGSCGNTVESKNRVCPCPVELKCKNLKVTQHGAFDVQTVLTPQGDGSNGKVQVECVYTEEARDLCMLEHAPGIKRNTGMLPIDVVEVPPNTKGVPADLPKYGAAQKQYVCRVHESCPTAEMKVYSCGPPQVSSSAAARFYRRNPVFVPGTSKVDEVLSRKQAQSDQAAFEARVQQFNQNKAEWLTRWLRVLNEQRHPRMGMKLKCLADCFGIFGALKMAAQDGVKDFGAEIRGSVSLDGDGGAAISVSARLPYDIAKIKDPVLQAERFAEWVQTERSSREKSIAYKNYANNKKNDQQYRQNLCNHIYTMTDVEPSSAEAVFNMEVTQQSYTADQIVAVLQKADTPQLRVTGDAEVGIKSKTEVGDAFNQCQAQCVKTLLSNTESCTIPVISNVDECAQCCITKVDTGADLRRQNAFNAKRF